MNYSKNSVKFTVNDVTNHIDYTILKVIWIFSIQVGSTQYYTNDWKYSIINYTLALGLVFMKIGLARVSEAFMRFK